jgi:DNA-binding transcriptional MerR regulator
MRSGELARLVGVSTDTLRHYERLKLLAAPTRSSGGYRNYSPEAVLRVRLIRRALKLGFSLGELRTILCIRDTGGAPCERVRALAQTKVRQLDQQIRDLLALRGDLSGVLKDWNRRLEQNRRGQPARLLENLPTGFGIDISPRAKRAPRPSTGAGRGERKGCNP